MEHIGEIGQDSEPFVHEKIVIEINLEDIYEEEPDSVTDEEADDDAPLIAFEKPAAKKRVKTEMNSCDGEIVSSVVPMSSSCTLKLGKNPVRLQLYEAAGVFTACVRIGTSNRYIYSAQLRSALAGGHCVFVQHDAYGGQEIYYPGIPVWEEKGQRIVSSKMFPRELNEKFDNWRDVANACQKFVKSAHGDYILSRFLDVNIGRNIELFATVNEDLGVTREMLQQCLSHTSLSTELRTINVKYKSKQEKKGLGNDYMRLGKHPLGLYSLFIRICDWNELFPKNYDSLTDEDTVRKAIQHVSATSIQLKNRLQDASAANPRITSVTDQTQVSPWSTITALSVQKLNKAGGAKRSISQKTVMYGHSASEVKRFYYASFDSILANYPYFPLRYKVATIFGWSHPDYKQPYRMRHRAEWLHRSAFSFGGLGFGTKARLENSQQAKNLIFGSVEANTCMIRPESSMKRLVRLISSHLKGRKTGQSVGEITTMLQPVNLSKRKKALILPIKGDPKERPYGFFDPDPRSGLGCIWLATELIYIMELKLSVIPGLENFNNLSRAVFFNPFGRAIPLKFEAKLDVLMEEAWFNSLVYGLQ
ncbi:unnamed protein product [Rhizoctonia solani]|uniref:Uncharacterized protein n=1 Tax=Rhizoctonia solani TaxID=456999 RepID=A0A8H3BAR5_9AGAM|nr:unnamed protein product [Rhizoctonia solani]